MYRWAPLLVVFVSALAFKAEGQATGNCVANAKTLHQIWQRGNDIAQANGKTANAAVSGLVDAIQEQVSGQKELIDFFAELETATAKHAADVEAKRVAEGKKDSRVTIIYDPSPEQKAKAQSLAPLLLDAVKSVALRDTSYFKDTPVINCSVEVYENSHQGRYWSSGGIRAACTERKKLPDNSGFAAVAKRRLIVNLNWPAKNYVKNDMRISLQVILADYDLFAVEKPANLYSVVSRYGHKLWDDKAPFKHHETRDGDRRDYQLATVKEMGSSDFSENMQAATYGSPEDARDFIRPRIAKSCLITNRLDIGDWDPFGPFLFAKPNDKKTIEFELAEIFPKEMLGAEGIALEFLKTYEFEKEKKVDVRETRQINLYYQGGRLRTALTVRSSDKNMEQARNAQLLEVLKLQNSMAPYCWLRIEMPQTAKKLIFSNPLQFSRQSKKWRTPILAGDLGKDTGFDLLNVYLEQVKRFDYREQEKGWSQVTHLVCQQKLARSSVKKSMTVQEALGALGYINWELYLTKEIEQSWDGGGL